MNRFLAGVCVLALALCAATPAVAGDFKGFYVGGIVGGASSNSDAHTFTAFSPTGYFATTSPGAISIAGTQKLSGNGFTGGGEAGYNFQSNSFVFGLETDIGAMHLNQSKSSTGTYPCCAPTGFTVTQSMKTSWLYTLRPRIGYTGGPVLVYGTGGLAVTNLNYQSLFTDTFATAHEAGGVKSNQMGWVAGGGLEYKTGKHWSIKGEYLYGDFGSVRQIGTDLTAFTPPIAFPTNPFTHTADLTSNIYRFGFNYRF
jgi:outer membrane immunogenic protein